MSSVNIQCSKMKIINSFGKGELAKVYIAEYSRGNIVEFVESLQPPIPRHEKWVLIISTSCGCPIRCLMCDAGGNYRGKLSVAQIFEQIDVLVSSRYPDYKIPAKKFKIQFARMGEPSFNVNVLEVLKKLPDRYDAPGLMPCISTVAPNGTDYFFVELLDIKNKKYNNGKFQLQFSIHSTDENERDRLMPVAKWSLPKIAEYGEKFYQPGDRKVVLNFALACDIKLNTQILKEFFAPKYFMIKFTPLNPTFAAIEHGLQSFISPYDLTKQYEIVDQLRAHGYDTLISIGENEENLIGSNCGQYVSKYLKTKKTMPDSYSPKYLHL